MRGGEGGGGTQQLQRLSDSAQCSENQPRVGGGGGGLKFEENSAEKTINATPKKKLGIGSHVFCTFSFTPNPITKVQHGSNL